MSDTAFQILAIGLYFVLMLAIGFYAFRRTSDLDDYMLGGRKLTPTVAALSAGASDMSGWLLLGVPGAIYASGLIESWIVIGLVIGAWLNWKFVAPRLRAYTEIANNSITVPSFFENRLRDKSHVLRISAGAIILVFFTFYVSSGMVAGGVFFETSFGSSYLTGMLLVAGVTLCYTLFGGFLGASLTDVAQALLMFAALVTIPVVTIIATGGPGRWSTWSTPPTPPTPAARSTARRCSTAGVSSPSCRRRPGDWATSASRTSSSGSWRCVPRPTPRPVVGSASAG